MDVRLLLGDPVNRRRMIVELNDGEWRNGNSIAGGPGGRSVIVADGIGLPAADGPDLGRSALVFVCADAKDPMIPDVLSRGAAALVSREDAVGIWRTAVREVAGGSNWISPKVATLFLETGKSFGAALDFTGVEHLTDAQRQVIVLMVTGMTRAEAAETLFIQESTAAYHVRRGLQRLGCANIRELQARIIKEGMCCGPSLC
ncbi:response regulator transcription factor [Streptomyces sp. NPDC056716]|uniref:response regulator transcription factor n=1 Tax=unclassified Streptomyces TaxID=2593676 RepID=UPI0036CBE017